MSAVSFESSPSLRVTWTIPDFFNLYTESRCSLQSPEFAFADDWHYLQLFPTTELSIQSVGIKLLNSTDTDPGRTVLYEVALKTRIREFDMLRHISDPQTFLFNRSKLELNKGWYVPNGTLTVLCYVRLRNPTSAGSIKSDKTQTQATSKCRMSIGELSFQSFPFLYVTWRIPKFFQLPQKSKYTLECPEFPFSDRRYSLRLVSNGDGNTVDICLVNMTDTIPEKYVSYEVGVKSTTGEEIYLIRHDTSTSRVFYILHRVLNEKESECFTDGHLTVFCSMRSIEPSRARSPNSAGETRAVPKCRMSIGELSFQSFPFMYVTWRIPGFFKLSRKSSYTLESPEFPFSARRYSLQLISNRDSINVVIWLVNITGMIPGKYVSYEVGLKSTTGEEIDLNLRGTSTTREFYILHRELNEKKSECFPDDHLTVFCSMRSREPSSAGSPNSGAAEIQVLSGSIKPLSHADTLRKSVGVQTSNEKEDKDVLPGMAKLKHDYRYLLQAA